VEYPVAAVWEGGQLLGGYIDLVSITNGRLDVLDFKTDTPARSRRTDLFRLRGSGETAPRRLMEQPELGDRSVRCGLQITGEGGIRWV
jgi:hypothetical protein